MPDQHAGAAGQPGRDVVDTNRGDDRISLDEGDDEVIWDPGDGSDLVDGSAGFDVMTFNGAGGNEIMEASAIDDGLIFTRDVGNIRMDTERLEQLDVNALGGADKLELTAPLAKDGPQVEFFDGPGQDVAARKDGIETPRWLRLRASGDNNSFDALPEWCRKPDPDTRARDYDAAGFLLRHRLD